LAKTYADWEEKLMKIYKEKYRYFEFSVIFTMISLIVSFMFTFGQVFAS
jgi:hypothetical protein